MNTNPTNLIGRDALLERLFEEHRAHAIVALVGAPGVGKTALARALHRRSKGLWVRMNGARGEEEALERCRAALEMPQASRDQVVQACAGPLFLDGASGVPSALIFSLRDAGAQLVLTTRRDPRLRAAHVTFIDPLSLAPGPAGSDAARLLCRMARARGVEIDWDDASTRAEVERLVSMLSGVPAALELAASRVRVLGVAGLTHHLSQDLGLLEQRLCDLSSRQHNFSRMLEEVWGELAPASQAALYQCAVFDEAFGVEALVEALGAPLPLVLEVLEPLIERALLRAEPSVSGMRFELLGVMRRFVRERPAYAERTGATRARHRDDILERARHARAMERPTPEFGVSSWLALPEPPTEVLVAVVMHARELTAAKRAWRAWTPGVDPEGDALLARFEALYVEPERWRLGGSEEDASLEDLGVGWADPLGEVLQRAQASLRLGATDAAEALLQGVRAGFGGEPHGVRGVQCLELELELRVRQGRVAEAARLARGRLTATPLSAAWCRAMAWSLLLAMEPALQGPHVTPDRIRASWRVAGLRVPVDRWEEASGPLRALAPVLRVLGWDIAGSESGRGAELARLLAVTLEARLDAMAPGAGALAPWVEVWQRVEAGEGVSGFEVLIARAIKACLGHERLHSLADQLHQDQPQVTIDLKEHRFRVGRQGWVGFGHRPRAMRLIERLTRTAPSGGFEAVTAPELIEYVWPGEQIRYDSAQARLYNLIANVRKLGLGDVLVHERDGYQFDPGAVVHVVT